MFFNACKLLNSWKELTCFCERPYKHGTYISTWRPWLPHMRWILYEYISNLNARINEFNRMDYGHGESLQLQLERLESPSTPQHKHTQLHTEIQADKYTCACGHAHMHSPRSLVILISWNVIYKKWANTPERTQKLLPRANKEEIIQIRVIQATIERWPW